MENKNQFTKNFIWNILGTGFNAFNSLFFLIAVTRINGIDDAGIFTLAYSTACIIYVIGIYAGRIYQVTELDKNVTDKDYIINRVITTILMNILVLMFCLIRKYNIFKTIVFFLVTLYKSLEAFSDVFYGILQKNEKLELVGKSLFSKSCISVITFIVTDIIFKNIIISIISVVIIWGIITVIYDFRKANKYIDYSTKLNIKNVFKIFKLGFSTFAITFLGLYVINAPKYSIDNYLENSLQTIFGIIVMPATVVGLFAQFLIHPFLNQILNYYENRNLKDLKKMIFKLIISILIFGVISSIVAYLIGTQVLGFIYGLNLSEYKIGLFIIIIASTLYTIGTVYSSVLITVRETFSQLIIYIIVSLFALFSSNLLTIKFQLNGAFIAYLSIMTLQFLLYMLYTNFRLKFIFKDNIKDKN